MAGPLSLLGDAIQQGTRDYLNIQRESQLHQRSREEQLADEARQRENTLADRADARKYDQSLYNKRRLDGVVDQLVSDGYLKPEDIGNPDAVNAALQLGGKDYQRNIQELAAYKASLPGLLQHVAVPGAEKLLSLNPDQIDEARSIMGTVSAAVSKETEKHQTEGDTAKRNGGAYFNLLQGKIANVEGKLGAIDSQLNSINDGTYQPTAEEIQQAKQAVLLRRPELTKPTPNNLAELRAETQREIFGDPSKGTPGLVGIRAFKLQQQRKDIDQNYRELLRSQANFDDMMKGGAFNDPNFKIGGFETQPGTAAPAPAAPAPARDPAAYDPHAGKAQPATPAPAALGNDGLAPLLSLKGVAQRLDPAAVIASPGALVDTASRYGGAALGGAWNGDFKVPEKGPLAITGSAIGSALANTSDQDQVSAIDAELARTPPEQYGRRAYLNRLRDSFTNRPTATALGQ